MAPKHPKNAIRDTMAPVAIIMYTAPMNKFVPSNSFTKLLSIIVHIPKPKTVSPPNCRHIKVYDLKKKLLVTYLFYLY